MSIEAKIAMHCGPTLAGLKPSNMLSISKSQYPDLHAQLAGMNRELNGCDIFFEILCECEKRVLVMVYHRENLCKCINKPETADFLHKYGYPSGRDLHACIEFLRRRVNENGEFPHEIGAFLGYPMCDVYGFINHKDIGCMYTGYWKVYDNVESAKELFSEYDRCRSRFVRLINQGARLSDLVMAC